MTEFKDRALKKSFLTRAVNKAKRQMNDGEVDNIKVRHSSLFSATLSSLNVITTCKFVSFIIIMCSFFVITVKFIH